MLRNFLKNRKAQNTAEYALLIALVTAGAIAMTTYVQRSVQSEDKKASDFMATQTATLGTATQYEPYYLSSDYKSSRNASDTSFTQQNGVVGYNSEDNSTRVGTQTSSFSNADVNQ